MLPKTYLKLCITLKQNIFLQSSRYVKITEQVAAFCLVMAQGHTQRIVVDRLQQSLHTISIDVNRMAKALCRLGKTIIRLAAIELPHPYVALNSRYYLWFAISHTIMCCITCSKMKGIYVLPFVSDI